MLWLSSHIAHLKHIYHSSAYLEPIYVFITVRELFMVNKRVTAEGLVCMIVVMLVEVTRQAMLDNSTICV